MRQRTQDAVQLQYKSFILILIHLRTATIKINHFQTHARAKIKRDRTNNNEIAVMSHFDIREKSRFSWRLVRHST